MRTVKAVSYTHLDVYKRQDKRYPGEFTILAVRDANVQNAAGE